MNGLEAKLWAWCLREHNAKYRCGAYADYLAVLYRERQGNPHELEVLRRVLDISM